MAQQLLDGLQEIVRKDLCTIIRKELAAENKETSASDVSEALWPVQELKAIAHLTTKDTHVPVFKLIPDLTVSCTPKTAWVGLSMPKEPIPSLHGDLTWHEIGRAHV